MTMIIGITKNLSNNMYTATISLQSIDSADSELIKDFGEPQVEFGGDFNPTSDPSITNTFSIASNIKPVKSGLPRQVTFSGANAKDFANDWVTAVTARMAAVLGTLRTEVDDFTSTSTDSI